MPILEHHRVHFAHIYIYAVKLKNWSNFLPFLKWNTGPFFFFFENLILPAERRGFLKNKQKTTTKKTQFLKLKTGPIMLRNMLGPGFSFNLDQFLTLEFCFFLVFLLFVLGWKPYFYSVFSKNAKLKETQKTKKDTICEHTCANCSCQNVRFFLHFWFLLFLEFPCFQRCSW